MRHPAAAAAPDRLTLMKTTPKKGAGENVRALFMDTDTITEKILCCLNKACNYDPPKHPWSQHEPQQISKLYQRLALYRMYMVVVCIPVCCFSLG